VLYGADLAKREIAQRRQAVLVEGYTDVMACHLAGVPTAVATSGTSFGDGHIKILRRLLMDADQFRGEVIFTFDGDAAGQRAVLRAFDLEEHFVTQTFVAVQRDGLDPCDLRLKQGEGAVRDLIAQRLPVFEFAIRSELAKHNLDTNEGRLAALDAAARIVARIKDRGLRDRYAVSLDRWLGMLNEEFVLARVREHGGSLDARRRGGAARGAGPGGSGSARGSGPGGPGSGGPGSGPARVAGSGRAPGPGGVAARAAAGRGAPDGTPYDANDPVVNLERQALKLAIQRPALCGPVFDSLVKDDFSVPVHAAVRELIAGCGGVAAAGTAREWAARVIDAAPNDRAREFVTRLAVEPVETPRADGEADARYAEEVLARVGELAVSRQISTLKSRLQRLNPTDGQGDYNRTFGDLVALEQRRKALLERASGAL
jgi:DNA primase